MTKEALEKEADKYADDYATPDMAEIKTEKDLREKIMNEKCSTCRYNTVGQDEYITALEEQNKELEEQIQKWKEDYICLENLKDNQIKELEEQIEKMKTRIKEIIFSNDFVNTSPYQNCKNKVSALCDFYKEIKEK